MKNKQNSYFIEPVDKSSFSLDKFGAIRHNYQSHPLLQMDSLEALAKRLYPKNQCRFVKGKLSVGSEFYHHGQSPLGLSIEETFRRIEEPGSWVGIYNIETDPTYNKFVSELAASVRNIIQDKEKILCFKSYIFISSPPSVTPFHIDSENNFWLQIRGRKKMTVWNRDDHMVLKPSAADHFIMTRGLQEVTFKENILKLGSKFDCGAGDGLYFPSTTPHMTESDTSWVQAGDGIVVSLAVVFYTDVTRRTAYAHALNKMMRRYLRMNPRPVRESKIVDNVKYSVGQVAVKLFHRLRRLQLPPGF